MRLLLFTTEFPNPYEPTKAVFNRHLASALAARHEVRVVSPIQWVEELRGRARLGRRLDGRRRVRLDGIDVFHPRFYYPPKVLRRQYGRALWWSARRTVAAVLRDFRPDAVLGYWAHPDGEAAVRAARQAGATAGILVGGSDILVHCQSEGRRRTILQVLHSADAVITVGRHIREKVVDYGVNPDKVYAWSRGVDLEKFSPGDRAAARHRLGLPADGPVLLWCGRMVPVKALGVLLRACAELRRRGQEFRLCLIGDGELRAAHEAEARALGLGDAVWFLGIRPHDQLPDWFRAADLTVLPSLSEGLPNVLRESLACGTRFVASRVGGIPEMATEPLDRLVPPNDPFVLADAIAAALANPAPPPGRGTCTRSWEEEAEALVRILRSIRRSAGGLLAWPRPPVGTRRTPVGAS